MLPILIPLFISAFRRADELAIAMEARCYRGGEGRTRMHELVYKTGDFIALAIICAFNCSFGSNALGAGLMMRTFKLTVAYDGSGYHGFQRQPRDITVQQVLEDALSRITGENVVLAGSGRTDSGRTRKRASCFFYNLLRHTVCQFKTCHEQHIAPGYNGNCFAGGGGRLSRALQRQMETLLLPHCAQQ